MCWRATASAPSATCAISPIPSSTTLATPIAEGADRRGARHARRPGARRARLCGGARRRSRRSRSSNYGRTDYGSALRDAAAFVTLASEGSAPRRDDPAGGRARRSRARPHALHLDAGECLDGAGRARARARTRQASSLDVAGETRHGPLYRTFAPADLAAAAALTNTGEGTMQAVVSVIGAPLTPEPAADKGFKIERLYYTLDGEPADVAKVKQNDALRRRAEDHRAAAAIRPHHHRRLSAGRLRDRQPAAGVLGRNRHAGLDPGRRRSRCIRNSATTISARRSTAKSSDPAVFTVAYVVRAVSPGRYVLPQAYVEDMYRPDRFGRTATGTVEVTQRCEARDMTTNVRRARRAALRTPAAALRLRLAR